MRRANSPELDSFFVAYTNSSMEIVKRYWAEITLKDTNSVLSASRILALQDLENQLNNTGPVYNLHEENLRTLSSIYRETFTEGIDTLTPNQLVQIENIAQQCAMTGGPSVYIARSLRWVANGTIDYDYDDVCVAQTGSNKMAQTNQNLSTKTNCPYTIQKQLGAVVITTDKLLTVQVVNTLGQIEENFTFTGVKELANNTNKLIVLRITDSSTKTNCYEKVVY